MSSYFVYQCSICRRTKDILRDDVRAIPNQCTITKGCEGRLFKIGETAISVAPTPITGLTDWYARGKKVDATPVEATTQTIALSTTTSGGLTLALYQTPTEHQQNPDIFVKFQQRRVEDISYQQYIFKITTATSLLSGKDSTDKVMRFDQASIDEGRVFVRVNGVAKENNLDMVLSPNTVTFNSSIGVGSTVDVSVYLEKDTIERTLPFSANSSSFTSSTTGAWGNISWLGLYNESHQLDLTSKRWYVYHSTGLGGINSSSRLKLDGIYDDTGVNPLGTLSDARFLLASSPYENADRYLNFVISAEVIAEDFSVASVVGSITELYADASAIEELYPPIQLLKVYGTESSYIVADTFTTSSAVPTDTANIKLSGSKIIGPV